MTLLYCVCALPVLASIGFTLLFVYQCWIFRRFKGPLAFPFIGNLYTVKALNLISYFSNQRKKFGKVFVFFGLWRPRLIVCDPVVVRRILSDSKTFPKGHDYRYFFHYVFGDGLVTSNGEKHKKDRAVFGKYFIKSNVLKLTGLINDVTKEAIDTMLLAPCTENGNKPVSINIETFFATVSLRIFMSFSVGTNYRDDPKREMELCHTVSEASGAVGQCILFGYPMWASFLPDIKRLDACKASVLKDFNLIVNNRRKMMENGEEVPDDCLYAMIKENLPIKDMQDHFMTLICAGHDTTAFFSSYLILLLARHPDVQEKLRNEVFSQLKGRKVATADDVAEMTYLAKVMQETLRYFAIIPQVTRTSIEEVHIKEAGITIPKGVQMLIPMSIINRDPSVWDKPQEFNPDRFEGRSVDFTSAKNGFFPFGYGTRTCIGNTLAQLESGIFVCHLLTRLSFDVDPGFKVKIHSGISLTTIGGIKVLVKPL